MMTSNLVLGRVPEIFGEWWDFVPLPSTKPGNHIYTKITERMVLADE
jgi:hypothetical protein